MSTPSGYADISIEMRHALQSRPAFITFGCNPTATDPASVGASIAGCISTAGSLNSRMDAQVTWTGVHVSLGTDGGEDIVGIHTMALVGGYPTNSLPANCSVLVHKRTTRGGRRGRGRLFIPWYATNADVGEGGLLISALVTALQNTVNTFLTALSTNSVPMVLLHRASAPGTVHPSTPGAPNDVTSLTVDPLIATQRRRLGR